MAVKNARWKGFGKPLPLAQIALLTGGAKAEPAVLAGLSAFAAEKIVLVAQRQDAGYAQGLAGRISALGVQASCQQVSSLDSVEEVFMKVSEVAQREGGGRRLLLNVGSDCRNSWIAMCAAFVNGIQAVGFHGGRATAFPLMKFSYFSELSEKKLGVLMAIEDMGGVDSMVQLGKAAGMSLPLASYHVSGSRNKAGLEELGLVEAVKGNGGLKLQLSLLGKLVLHGGIGIADGVRVDRKPDGAWPLTQEKTARRGFNSAGKIAGAPIEACPGLNRDGGRPPF